MQTIPNNTLGTIPQGLAHEQYPKVHSTPLAAITLLTDGSSRYWNRQLLQPHGWVNTGTAGGSGIEKVVGALPH